MWLLVKGKGMEQWKPVVGYEGLYEVSSLGNVRSLDRVLERVECGTPWFYPGKVLKPDIRVRESTSYARVTLSKDHVTNRQSVHRIVLEAFVGPPTEDRPFVNHIDNNGLNNSVENLEWCSHSENMIHAQKQGRLLKSQSEGGKKGSKRNKAKLIEKFDKITNTYVNDWYVLPEGLIKRSGKYYASCVCRCGFKSLVESGRLLREHATSCRKCAARKKKI